MGVEPFRDNWSYLKVEINWLERILLSAVAKARAIEAKTVRHAKTSADRASRDWWIGLMDFEKTIGHDSPAPAASRKRSQSSSQNPAQSYQQQIDERIRLSQAAGISLALPMLCDRYALSLFERQTVLLAIAPEVHRRYGELCGYLSNPGNISTGNISSQGSSSAVGLPTVDLALRLFCRDDRAWRIGRSQLLTGSLVTEGLLEPFLVTSQSFLQQTIKLNPHWVSELLGGENLLCPSRNTGLKPSPITPIAIPDTVLPTTIRTQVDRTSAKLKALNNPGSAVICIGIDRLSKKQQDPRQNDRTSEFYEAIGHRLNLQPYQLDLDTVHLTDLIKLIDPMTDPKSSELSSSENDHLPQGNLLVIRSAQQLLSRNSGLSRVEKMQFINHIRSSFNLILLDINYPIALEQVWRSWISESLNLPLGKI